MSLPSDLLSGLLDLVFAPCCASCGDPLATRGTERLVCRACWARSRSIPPPFCQRCQTPRVPRADGELADCPLCPRLRPAVRGVRSAYLMDGPVRTLVHGLKYRGWIGLAEPMAERMAGVRLPAETEAEIEVLVSVPTTASRVRQRGFDQAARLAGLIAGARGVPYAANVLVRRARSGSQTALHPDGRRANVAGVFTANARNAGPVLARHVLLVDDVWTTGSTALACSDELLRVGARAVTVLTFARALPELERHYKRLETLAFSHS